MISILSNWCAFNIQMPLLNATVNLCGIFFIIFKIIWDVWSNLELIQWFFFQVEGQLTHKMEEINIFFLSRKNVISWFIALKYRRNDKRLVGMPDIHKICKSLKALLLWRSCIHLWPFLWYSSAKFRLNAFHDKKNMLISSF